MKIELYQKTNDPDIGKQLLAEHRDVIDKHIAKWSGVLPDIVIKKQADKYALEAFKTFDPSHGASINTHLFNHLSKLSRLNYAHQNVVKIPEHQILQITHYQDAVNTLKDKYDRQPTIEEVADYMVMPIPHVERLSRNLRKDFTYDSDKEDIQQTSIEANPQAMYIQNRFSQLKPLERKMFQDLTGFNNTPILKPQDFGKKYKMEPYQVSRIKTSLAKKFGDLS